MTPKSALLLLLMLPALVLTAQHETGLNTRGKWKVTSYPGNITKVTFTPDGYRHNEQVSNAVIAKPLSNKKSSVPKEMLRYFDSGIYKGFTFSLQSGEKIFGTGERSIPLDRRGYKLNLYNNPWYGYSTNADNLNYSVPFIISSKGYGLFFDNPSKAYLDIGKSRADVLEYGASSGELTFYYIPGKNIDEILHKYHTLVGTQPIPARWVFGNLMSRFGYRSQDHLTTIVGKMKDEHIPLDAVIIDLFWFGDSIQQTLGNLEWNKSKWPTPEKMIADFKKDHINTILITEPFIIDRTPNYEPSKKYDAVDSSGKPFLLTDFYFGHGGLLDIFRKDAQAWFWSKYKPQVTKGVAGWWGDLGEPERHPAAIYHNLKDLGFKRLFKADEVHNIYGHYWDKMLYDRYAKEYPTVRLFNLNRSGYAGSPRYGVFPWSGDVSRSWQGFQAQLPLMLGMSMSGVPYIHADAGGFAGGDGDGELYTRWLQFATFTPVFRPHGTALGDLVSNVKDIPSEAALWPDPFKSIVRRYINYRYNLLPYNYTLAYEQARWGKPLVRPLFYYSAADSNLSKTNDEYYWGDNILVAPVLEKSALTRTVYLPQGKWYNFTTDKMHTGNAWVKEPVTLEDIPVYVRAGSILPLFIKDSIHNTTEYTGKNITIKYYPSEKKTSYTLYDDDGHINKAFEKGDYQLIDFTAQTTGKDITFHIKSRKKDVRKLLFTLPQGYQIQAARQGGKAIGFTSGQVEVDYQGIPVNLTLTVR